MLNKLKDWFLPRKTICIVGLGGLGTHVAKIMANSRVNIILIDSDFVAIDNLHRQVLYDENDIGKYKAVTARKKLKQLYPQAKIRSFVARINEKNIYLLDSDLVFDCSDNLDTKYLINRYCTKNKLPWVYCTVAGSKGFVRAMSGACLKCFYKTKPLTSESLGILPTAVSMAAAFQTSLGLMILAGKIDDHLISFDAWDLQIKKISVKKNPRCEVCA